MNRPSPARLLSQRDVARLLDLPSCIDAVERVFRLQRDGRVLEPGVLGTHAVGGGFHAKTAGMLGDRSYFAAKLNANFPDNRRARALPTIQGLVLLFDATTGVPLAIMDSIEITRLRTAAASAVAAKYASRIDSRVLCVIGCGAQALPHLDALHRPAARSSDIIITCTTSREPILSNKDLPPGVFVAAVGADSEEKQEIDANALADLAAAVAYERACAQGVGAAFTLADMEVV